MTDGGGTGSFERLKRALADRYALERELGRGGMATVYLAEDLKHHRKVAVKVLRPELAAALGAERFLREITIAAQLNHPHILPLHDSGDADGSLYYVMPYVEGESLRDRLTREKQLLVDDAITITREVADGLGYAHSLGVVHRDIKPENILLSGGHAVISDFGIARAVSEAGGGRLTETGLSLGTPTYMSPEQATAGTVDARSDIYSLGCVLYEMLVGEPPHCGPTPQAVLARRLSEPVAAPRTVRETIPPAVERVVLKALARTAADRYATAVELGAALVSAPAGPEWVARPAGPWHVAGLYVLSTLAVLGLIQLVVGQLGLPAWVVPGAVVLLLVGFPIIMVTALVQRGTLRVPRPARRLLTWRRALSGGVAALAAWGAVVTAYVVLQRREAPSGPVEAGVGLAILPFRVVGLDSAVWKWGMVNLLAANLNGVGNLRNVDSRTMESQWRAHLGGGRDPSEATVGVEVARHVGARFALAGSIVSAGQTLRLTADLYDTESRTHRGSARVDGSSDSVLSLVDRLSIEILRNTDLVPRVVSLPQVDLRRATTSSLDALKAYLEGEQLYRRSRWMEAIEQFDRAVALDSTFALALYRLSLAHGWLGAASERRVYAERAAGHGARLPERERRLLQGLAQLAHDDVRVIDAFEEYTWRYPDDAEGWTLLGSAYHDLGGLRLEPSDKFRSAYRRAIDLSPYFGPAYVLPLLDAFHRHDSAAVRTLLTGYETIDSGSDFCVGFRLAEALAWGDTPARQWAVRAMDTLPAGPFQPVMCAGVALSTSPEYWEPLQLPVAEALEPTRTTVEQMYGRLSLARGHMMRGELREGRRLLDRVHEARPSSIYPSATQVMLHVTHYSDTAAARRVALVLGEHTHRQAPFWLGVLAAADGRWSAVMPQLERLDTAAAQAVRDGDSVTAGAIRSNRNALELYAQFRRHPTAAVRSRLIELLPELSRGPDDLIARLLRYEVGRSTVASGEVRQAQRIFASFTEWDLGIGGSYMTPVEYYKGRLAEERGEVEAARLHYDRVIRWWAEADPELQPWRADARERLLGLTREPRSPE